jgi:hypothetical protein
MKQPVVILTAACVAVAAFVGWRMEAMRSNQINHFVLVQDPSRSYTGGCASLVGMARAVLASAGVSAESRLTVLALGDAATAGEPRRLGVFNIPTSRKVIEGQRAALDRRQELFRDILTRCESVRPTSISPIFLGVKQAVAELRANGCKAGSRCGLWVSTDLEENAARGLRERILNPREAREPLPPPLDNEGIEVTFCGFSQTAGRLIDPSGREVRIGAARDPRRDDRLQAVWRAMFTSPELVSFEPYCPESGDSHVGELQTGRHVSGDASLRSIPDGRGTLSRRNR